jgi:hypothetical protein
MKIKQYLYLPMGAPRHTLARRPALLPSAFNRFGPIWLRNSTSPLGLSQAGTLALGSATVLLRCWWGIYAAFPHPRHPRQPRVAFLPRCFTFPNGRPADLTRQYDPQPLVCCLSRRAFWGWRRASCSQCLPFSPQRMPVSPLICSTLTRRIALCNCTSPTMLSCACL